MIDVVPVNLVIGIHFCRDSVYVNNKRQCAIRDPQASGIRMNRLTRIMCALLYSLSIKQNTYYELNRCYGDQFLSLIVSGHLFHCKLRI